ncbi:MAG: MerR family transcriptional regulator [Clostridia bacterium]|nr:MerR family transcriptional regulator [Clostridia bacterium]
MALIGNAAEQSGISASAIRFYDKQGLLPGLNRSGGGTRVFGAEELERLQQIHALKQAGFSVEEIKWLLTSRAPAEKKLAFLEQKQALLQAAQDVLTQKEAALRAALPAPQPAKKKAVVRVKPKRSY